MNEPTFAEIKTETPTHEDLVASYHKLESDLRSAATPEELTRAVEAWDSARRHYQTYSALVHLRFEKDTRNADYKKALEYRDALDPKVIDLDTKMKRLLLEPNRREMLEPVYGKQVFALWESDVLTFDPAIQDDLVQEAKLENEYTELLASAKLPFDGETFTTSSIIKFRQVSNRQVRHDAEAVLWNWFSENGETLDRIYGELVDLRNSMAKKLGFADFIELGYKRMSRVDYSASDVAQFRKEVIDHVVPLGLELKEKQRERLGLEKLMAWDEAIHDDQDNPLPQGDHIWMIKQAKQMFDSMEPSLGEFFHHMVNGDYMDLKGREGKGGGGFCTSFPTYGMPYIFANFNGTKGDVEVFTHEMGHAFQGYQSRGQIISEYLWPTYESCEIHSMSLEFLTWPQMEKFFGDSADRFRTIHLTESLFFLPYGVAVDHFQHLIYAEPDASPERRHAMWKEMEAIYLPWRDWGDLSYPAKGGRWQFQRHIYGSPFYYIDYALAQTCALQFWLRAQQDESGAMRDYVALCKRGGEAPFQELARGAGLVSPFEPGCLAGVVAAARAFLG